MSKLEIEYENISLQEHQKNRSSNCTTAPQVFSSELQNSLKLLTGKFYFNHQKLFIFHGQQKSPDISSRLIEKAISWLQVAGYVNNFTFSSIIQSIALFYASFYQLTLSKNQIQPILCACILLASKMSGSYQFSMADVLNIVNYKQTAQTIIEKEQKILKMLEFSLHFTFPVVEITENSEYISNLNSGQSQFIKNKFQFITEILLLKQPAALYNIQEIEEIIQLAEKPKLSRETFIGKKIGKMLKKNTCDHLINKYKGKFNVQEFLSYEESP